MADATDPVCLTFYTLTAKMSLMVTMRGSAAARDRPGSGPITTVPAIIDKKYGSKFGITNY